MKWSLEVLDWHDYDLYIPGQRAFRGMCMGKYYTHSIQNLIELDQEYQPSSFISGLVGKITIDDLLVRDKRWRQDGQPLWCQDQYGGLK